MANAMPDPRDTVSGLLAAHRAGDPEALSLLVPLVYEDLRRLARWQLRGSGSRRTLDTTALVHEAYLRLVDQTRGSWKDRAHFFAVAARAMRQILIDYARRRSAAKRGGGQPSISLEEERHGSAAAEAERLLALEEALEALARIDERLPRIVECRFFAGMTDEETAEALGVSTRTVQRDWMRARAWLREVMGGAEPPGEARS
jgi:RNA polymerase sigma factor (TIGR02999 family)